MTVEMFRTNLINARRERYIKLKTALLDFQALTYEFSDCGSKDSSFEIVWQGILYASSIGIEPKVFFTAKEWRLYEGKRSNKAAKLMGNKMEEIVDLILGFDFIDDEIMAYIKSFCWRFID